MTAPLLKLGLIGIGNIGNLHARNIAGGLVPGVQLMAVAEADPTRLAGFEPENRILRRFAQGEALIRSGAVDAVLICTPHFSHTSLGIAALQQGLHVLVEKPLSVHKADAQRLLSFHTNPRQVFGLMLNQRTDPRYRRLREMIQGGELGRIQRINWTITDWFRTEHYYASGGWRATWAGEGGGVLINQCPHQLDLWQWLFGRPRTVTAFGGFGRHHAIEVEDDVTAILEYSDGARGVFITTTGEAPGTNRLEIAAERGKVVVEGDSFVFQRNAVETSFWSRQAASDFEKPPVETVSCAMADTGTQHAGILANFVAACLQGTELIAPAAEGLASVELANAMLLSLAQRTPVELPMDASRYETVLQGLIASSAAQRAKSAAGPVA